jgi:hypothetical protein
MDSTACAVIRREAQRLATSGHRQVALDLLDTLRGADSDAETAMLRAKILCQQGSFARAAASWREVLATAPDDDRALRGLALAERLARHPLGRARLHARHWGAALVVLMVLGAGMWAVSRAARSPSSREPANSQAGIERQHVEELRAAVARTETAVADLKRSADAGHVQLSVLLAEQARASSQLRRLERRTTQLLKAAQPGGTPSPEANGGPR